MNKNILLLIVLYFTIGQVSNSFLFCNTQSAAEGNAMVLNVKKTNDFPVTGDGNASAWETTEWTSLPQRGGADIGFRTDIKILHSDTGMYFLFRCGDRKLTASMGVDFLDLWNEDVVELFLWPDERYPVYFEYELSPLNHELPILIPNFEGKFLGWRPWHYEGERMTRHATSVKGGKKESGATISEWTAEIFIPYALLKPLQNVPPRSGTQWRANFYRNDYDTTDKPTWSWQPVGRSYHEYKKFGTLVFE